MYINNVTKEQQTWNQLKKANPDLSIAVNGTPIITINFDDWYLIVETAQPDYDPDTQTVAEGEPEFDGNQYNQMWVVTDMTQQEIDDLANLKSTQKQGDMVSQGETLTAADQARLTVGATGIISDRPAHDAWMQDVYVDYDNGVVSTPKPPATERQALTISYEQNDPFTFTRYQDQWGWRWRLDLTRSEVNNLSIGIYDSNGGYLYTIGALIDNGDGTYYGECPAGQADPTPEDVYFIWLLGAGHISDLECYKGADETYSGYVKSDEEYDL